MSENTNRVSSSILDPSRKPHQPFQEETPATVKAYLDAVGIVPWLSDADFQRSLSQRFGSDSAAYLKALSGNGYWNRYEVSLEPANLELALAVRSQLDGSRYAVYFSWFTAADLPQPKRILDVGCDVGVTTCFYATLYPQATIIGIDKCGKAIQCARRLAAKLHLTNVEFIEADLFNLPKSLKRQKFDLVCSNCLAENMTAEPPSEELTVDDLLAGHLNVGKLKYARALAGRLTDDRSILVSFEDAFMPHYLAGWLFALREARVYVPYDAVAILPFFDRTYDFEDRLLVMTGTKQVVTLPTAEEIRSLWTGGMDESSDEDVYEGIMAESVLAATEPKEFRGKIFRELPYEVCFTIAFWNAGSHVLVYKYGDDKRQLVRIPAEDPERLIDLLLDAFDDTAWEDC